MAITLKNNDERVNIIRQVIQKLAQNMKQLNGIMKWITMVMAW